MGRGKRVGKGQGERRNKPNCHVVFRKTFFAVVMSHVLNNVAGCALFFSFLSFLF